MRKIELKPCPFCGGEVRMIEFPESPTLRAQYQVACRNEKCRIQPLTFWTDTPEWAAYFWNTRKGESK